MTTVAAGQAPGIGTPAELKTEYQRTYPGRADQVRHGRRDVAGHLGDKPVTDIAVLVASEFAAKTVLHSRSREASFTIRVELYCDYVLYGWNAGTRAARGEVGGIPMTGPMG
jgi:hypothetical protein